MQVDKVLIVTPKDMQRFDAAVQRTARTSPSASATIPGPRIFQGVELMTWNKAQMLGREATLWPSGMKTDFYKFIFGGKKHGRRNQKRRVVAHRIPKRVS